MSLPNPSDNITMSKRTPSPWIVSDTIQEAVNKYIAENPVKYQAAQNFGDYITSHPLFSQVDTFKVEARDVAGEELLYLEICKTMKYYGIKPKELSEHELDILKQKLGVSWKELLIKDYDLELADFPEDSLSDGSETQNAI
jgi:hypothetical protein